ncbi:MAG: GNAT family N-acetyltransferase [Vulcanimicrobiaceae bacterium]
MKIRRARAQDRDAILSLIDRFAESPLPSWRSPEEINAGTRRHVDRALSVPSDSSEVLVALDAGRVVGFAWMLVVKDFYRGVDVAKLSEIAVTKDGSGIGSALMREAEAWARSRNLSMLVLNVMIGNSRARRLYEHHGFAPEYTMMAKQL